MWSLEWKPLDEGYEEEAIKILNSWEFKRFDVKFPHRYDPQRRFRVNRDRKRRPDNHSVETLGVILRHQLQCLLSRHTRVWGPYGVFELLKLAKKILLRVVPPHDWVGVGKIRNVELIWQEIKKNTVDWVPSEITKWLGDILEQHCAPMREPPRQKMSNRIGAPGKIALPKKDVSQILVEGLKLLFRVLKTMEKYGWESPTYRFHPEPTPETGGDENGTIALTDSMHKPPQTISNGVSDWSIYGEVMGNSITALPDSGADVCFISPETSMLLGLDPQPGTERLVRLADGRELVSPGAVDVPWNFRDEEETFDITCWILPGCGHQIILGSKFLEETKCLTTHRYRIQRKHISAPKYVRVNLIGEGKQWLSGLLNDIPVAALPDTGSDVMVMSRDYAWRVGLKVDSSPEDIVEVEFADGTTALTNGIVRDVIWSSGGHSIQCDFLVLNNLAVDVILAKDYLFDVDAFSNYRAHLIEDEDTEHLDIYGIRLVREFGERFGETLDQLEDDSIEDGTIICNAPTYQASWAY